MFKRLSSIIYLLYFLQSTDANLPCRPQRAFSFFAPCQDTCTTKASSPCIKKPGCYCEDPSKVWDKYQHNCVEQSQCTPGGGAGGGADGEDDGSAGGSGGASFGFGIHFGGSGGGGGGAAGGGEYGGGAEGGSGGAGKEGSKGSPIGNLFGKIHGILGGIFGGKGSKGSGGGAGDGESGAGGGAHGEAGGGSGGEEAGGSGGGSGGHSEGGSGGDSEGGSGGDSEGGSGGESEGGSGGHSEGGSGGEDSGSSGAVIGVHGSFNFGALFKKILNLPIKVPQMVIKTVASMLYNIISFNFKALSIPMRFVQRIVTTVGGVAKKVVKGGLNTVTKINSVNADLVAGIIGRIRSGVQAMIRMFASIGIFGLKTDFKVTSFFRDRVQDVVTNIFKGIIFISTKVGGLLKGGVRVLHIKQILNLPGIRTVVHFILTVRSKGMKVLQHHMMETGAFIDSIIQSHQDFFVPIFHKILNFVLAITNAIKQIQDGGKTTGLTAHIGGLSIGLGPIISGKWHICGLGGQTIGNETQEDGGSSSGGGGSNEGSSGGGGSSGSISGSLSVGGDQSSSGGAGASSDDNSADGSSTTGGDDSEGSSSNGDGSGDAAGSTGGSATVQGGGESNGGSGGGGGSSGSISGSLSVGGDQSTNSNHGLGIHYRALNDTGPVVWANFTHNRSL